MNVEDMFERLRPRRKVKGIAAALLPFHDDGSIAVDSFQQHLRLTRDAGLTNAVNMDTGYVNYLSETEQLQVLQWTRDALGSDTRFFAGAYIEGLNGEVVSLYRRKIDQIVAHGGIPILVQTTRLHDQDWRKKISTYAAVCRAYPAVMAFELSPVFAPNGEIFDDPTVRGLIEIPELKGLKHSSLDRFKELERLGLRDARRPDFRIYTGNDLGINMIEYGSDYLLGLATFSPEKFAERDQLWEAGDARYYQISDALQHLGNVAFRSPIPAYKHSAAVFLKMLGRAPSAKTHRNNPVRPEWEAEILRDCAHRLGYLRGDL
jgi:dihydrodipicolinate synthase/N-acetylneuraminate lyase